MEEDFELSELFSLLHEKNIKGSKFKLGDKIKIRSEARDKKSWLFDKNGEYEITGINYIDEDCGFEYSVKNIPYLLWEDEIQP